MTIPPTSTIDDDTTSTVDDDTISAVDDETTSAVGDETTSALDDDTTSVLDDDTTSALDDDTTSELDDENTSTIDDDTTSTIDDDITSTIDDETTSAVGDETTSALDDDTTSALVDDDTISSIDDATTTAVDDDTTSAVDNTTTVEIDNDITSAVDDATTSVIYDDTTAARFSTKVIYTSNGAALVVDVDNVYDAIRNGIIAFGNGSIIFPDTGDEFFLDQTGADFGSMTANLIYARGNTVLVLNTYTTGGIIDGSNEPNSAMYIGNSDGMKLGGSTLIGSANDDTFFAGADDEIITGSGINEILLQNTNRGGAIINQLDSAEQKTVNNISGYNPIVNFIRTTAETLANVTARFVDNALVLRSGNTTNTFDITGTQTQSEVAPLDQTTELFDITETLPAADGLNRTAERKFFNLQS